MSGQWRSFSQHKAFFFSCVHLCTVVTLQRLLPSYPSSVATQCVSYSWKIWGSRDWLLISCQRGLIDWGFWRLLQQACAFDVVVIKVVLVCVCVVLFLFLDALKSALLSRRLNFQNLPRPLPSQVCPTSSWPGADLDPIACYNTDRDRPREFPLI